MVERLRYIWQLLLIFSLLCIAGILAIPQVLTEITLWSFLITLFYMTLITLISYLVMARGIDKSDHGGVVVLLAGIVGKFLVHLFYLLAYWLVTKNLSKAFIITFFTLYLIFTFFLVIHLFKLLKNK